MTIDSHDRDRLETVPDRFEERLLACMLADFDGLTTNAGRKHARGRPRLVRSPSIALAVPALATATIVGVLAANAFDGGTEVETGKASTKTVALYKLASASAAAPTPTATGRYVVLRETDSESSQPGSTERTSVIDSQTGSSITFQRLPAGSEAPSELRSGPESSNTAAFYAALPTQASALRARLLAIAEAQQAKGRAFAEEQMKTGHFPKASAEEVERSLERAQPSEDNLIYEEANDMLWNPLVEPGLRSALYKVLASIGGFTLDANATDPAGRPAISMTLSSTVDGTRDTTTTYESQTTGAVLAQVWQTGSYTTTAVYQPVTSTNTVPPNPYGG